MGKKRKKLDLSEYGEGFVYFVRMGAEGPTKIGRADNPNSRINSIASSCPIEIIPILLIPGADIEKKLHAYFYRCWITGEWFESDGFLETHIKALMANVLGNRVIRRIEVPIVKPPELGEVDMETLAHMKKLKRRREKSFVPIADKRNEVRYRERRRA